MAFSGVLSKLLGRLPKTFKSLVKFILNVSSRYAIKNKLERKRKTMENTFEGGKNDFRSF